MKLLALKNVSRLEWPFQFGLNMFRLTITQMSLNQTKVELEELKNRVTKLERKVRAQEKTILYLRFDFGAFWTFMKFRKLVLKRSRQLKARKLETRFVRTRLIYSFILVQNLACLKCLTGRRLLWESRGFMKNRKGKTNFFPRRQVKLAPIFKFKI